MKLEELAAVIGAIGGIILGVVKALPAILNAKKELIEVENDIEDGPEEITRHIQPPMINSSLFPILKQMKTQISLHISTGNKGKDLILENIMHNKLQSFIEELQLVALAIDDVCESCSGDKEHLDLYKINMEAFDNAYLKYTSYWINNPEYTEDEKWCLDYVMAIFNKHHQANIDTTSEAIRHFCTSKYYSNCKARQDGINNVYIGAFQRTLMEIEFAFNEINGHMKGRVFKGVTI